MSKSTDQLVRDLLDREALRELTYKYCMYVWAKDAMGLVNLFTDDGTFDYEPLPPAPRQTTTGRKALIEFYTGTNNQVQYPFIHNHVITLNGNTATANCYADVHRQREGKWQLSKGLYRDTYQRVGEEWKFKVRHLTGIALTPVDK